jgi:uncharacterized protein YecE (DUF72 family)
MNAVKIGCCGFAGSQQRYLETFSAVEVQQTFYNPPQVTTAERWRANAPANFEFTLKASQLITHEATSPTYRRLRMPLSDSTAKKVGSFKPTAEVWNAWERTREIAAALRARVVVFQCPASLMPTDVHKEHLRRFFACVREDFAAKRDTTPALAWETRGHWSDAEVNNLCRQLALIDVVDPFLRMPVTQGDPYYFRLHGVGHSRYQFSDTELARLLDVVLRFESGGYCLFNNVSMREDAMRFARMLALRAELPDA